MRKPTASARKAERARGATPVPPPSTKKSGASRRDQGAARRAGDSRTPASRNGRGERHTTEKIVRGGKVTPAVDASASASRGKYVYCIIEAAEPLRFGPVGIGADPSEV